MYLQSKFHYFFSIDLSLILYSDHNSLARTLNSLITRSHSRLYPLVDLNNKQVLRFPGSLNEVYSLSGTTHLHSYEC